MGIHDVATLHPASHLANAALQAIKAGEAAIADTVNVCLFHKTKMKHLNESIFFCIKLTGHGSKRKSRCCKTSRYQSSTTLSENDGLKILVPQYLFMQFFFK